MQRCPTACNLVCCFLIALLCDSDSVGAAIAAGVHATAVAMVWTTLEPATDRTLHAAVTCPTPHAAPTSNRVLLLLQAFLGSGVRQGSPMPCILSATTCSDSSPSCLSSPHKTGAVQFLHLCTSIASRPSIMLLQQTVLLSRQVETTYSSSLSCFKAYGLLLNRGTEVVESTVRQHIGTCFSALERRVLATLSDASHQLATGTVSTTRSTDKLILQVQTLLPSHKPVVLVHNGPAICYFSFRV